MLIALFLFLRSLFGGADMLETRVEDAVADPARRNGALEVVERIETIQDELAAEVEAASAALRRVHERHDATRADYLAVLEPLQAARRDAARALLGARADLRGILTRQEWREVFPPATE